MNETKDNQNDQNKNETIGKRHAEETLELWHAIAERYGVILEDDETTDNKE